LLDRQKESANGLKSLFTVFISLIRSFPQKALADVNQTFKCSFHLFAEFLCISLAESAAAVMKRSSSSGASIAARAAFCWHTRGWLRQKYLSLSSGFSINPFD